MHTIKKLVHILEAFRSVFKKLTTLSKLEEGIPQNLDLHILDTSNLSAA